MSNQSTAVRRLIRKEVRQLLPLVLLSFGILIGLMVLWNLLPVDSEGLRNFGRVLPLAAPALFACGAAATQVSQEREQKTLGWLVSMPIQPELLFRTKGWAAIGCLAAIWIACWILIGIEIALGFFPGGFRLPFQDGMSELFVFDLFMWHFHSFYVLVCGFYASWRIKNSLLSLIAIIPLAFAPFGLIQLGYFVNRYFNGARYVDMTASASITFLVTAVFCFTLIWLARRTALRELSPTEAPRIKGDLTESRDGTWVAFFRPPMSSSRPERSTPYSNSLVSLYWYSISHNRVALTVIVSMIILGTYAVAIPATRHTARFLEVWLAGAGYLGCCWLGVLAFAGDGNANRLRFFSDRGVSPAKLWLGRHLIGMTVLSCAALLSIAASVAFQSIDWDTSNRNLFVFLPIFAIAIYCYFISQWVSHVLQMLPAAIIFAPIMAGLALALPASVMPQDGFPLGHIASIISLAVLWILLPMLSTLITMRLFADGNRNRKFYAIQGCVVLLWVLITLVPAGLAYKEFPRISNSQLRSLANQATTAGATAQRSPVAVTARFPIITSDLFSGDPTPEETVALYQAQDFRPESLVSLPTFTNDSPGVSIDDYSFRELHAQACFDLLCFKAEPTDPVKSDAVEQWVAIMTNLATQLRKSPRLLDQSFADVAERWLFRTLTCTPYQSRLKSDTSRSAIALVTDRSGRADARRRAVLNSWANFNEDREAGKPNLLFGGYSEDAWSSNIHTPIEMFLFKKQAVNSIAFHSLAMIDAELNGQSSEQARRALHRVIDGQRVAFEQSEYGQRSRQSSASQAYFARRYVGQHLPMSQWFAAWETDALNLLDKPSE